MKIFYSNRIEVLLESFKKDAFENSTAFTYRHVITPTLPIEEWVKIQLALDPETRIGAGLAFSFLNPALQLLQDRFLPNTTKFPSQLEIKLAIENKIIEIVAQFEDLPESKQLLWLPLFNYIKGKEWLNPQKLSKRLLPLSERLAVLFVRYCIYGSMMVEKWKKEPFSHWQIELWNSLFSEGNPYGWTPFFKVLDELKNHSKNFQKIDFQIHVFAFSHLSKVHFEFLKELSSFISVTIYHLSCCVAFWSDITSDRENRWLMKKLQSKKVKDIIKEDLFSYLHNRHRFLANTGGVGKKQSKLYEESGVEIFENYLAPFKLENHPLYSDVSYPELYEANFEPPKGWLSYFQLDILLLKDPEQDEIVFCEKDSSIDVHAFTSRYQEVLNLYHRITKIIDQSNGALSPKDFFVMSPDITIYSPYIKSIFGDKDSIVSYHILDEKRAQNVYLEAFSLLMDIDKNRWNVTSMLRLFSSPLFQNKHKFTEDDFEQIEFWINLKGICWGYDLAYQKEVIEKRDPSNTSISEYILGHCSWKEQIEDLVKTLAYFPTTDDNFPSLTFTQTDLIGRLNLLITKIYLDTKKLNESSLKSLFEWVEIVKEIVEFYFGFEESASVEFIKNLDEISQASQRVNLKQITFTQFHFHFDSLFSKENNRLYSKTLQSVIFCSLLPMRAIPAQWIFMMGMNHDQFPRKEELNDLNLLLKKEAIDYLPSKKEFDRSLFLEAILSARKGVSISFISKSLSLKQSEPPSSLVEEFLSFINRSYFKFSPIEIHVHPLFSHDPAYFDAKSSLVNNSEKDYRLSKLLTEPEKFNYRPIFKPFEWDLFTSNPLPESCVQLDIKELLLSAKSPLKIYFQKKLECTFNEMTKTKPDEERFSLNPLEHYQLKNHQLKKERDPSLKFFNLPKGLFVDVAKNRLHEDFSRLSVHLNDYCVRWNDLYSIELHSGIRLPEWSKDGKRLRIPSLELFLNENSMIKMVGVIEKCSSKGIIIESEWSVKTGYQQWPLFLILSLLKMKYPEISSDMIFIKKKNQIKAGFLTDENQILKSLKFYLKYYFFTLQYPSPLYPEWGEAIEKNDLNLLHQVLSQSLDDPYHGELLKSCIQDVDVEIPFISKWSSLHSMIFDETFKKWIEKT